MRRFLSGVVLVALVAAVPHGLYSHCQVPCGIYDDYMRVVKMKEDASTIDKAITQIASLAGKTDVTSINQSVRWVMTKEQHAEAIIGSIANYYLTQRVKSDAADYATRLQAHHAVMVAAMKVKQDAKPATVTELRKAIDGIAGYYPEHTH